MARKMDTARGFRALAGAKVSIVLLGESTFEPGRIWTAAPLDAIPYDDAKDERERLGMSAKADRREVVFVMLTGGRFAVAEIDVDGLIGYGRVMEDASRVVVGKSGGFGRNAVRGLLTPALANRHAMTDAEILADDEAPAALPLGA